MVTERRRLTTSSQSFSSDITFSPCSVISKIMNRFLFTFVIVAETKGEKITTTLNRRGLNHFYG